LARILLPRTGGPIVYYTADAEPESGAAEEERGQVDGHDGVLDRGARREGAGAWVPGGRGDGGDECGGSDDARVATSWWTKLVNRVVGGAAGGGVAAEANRKGKKKGGAPEPYNLYDSEPGFRNAYGWTVSVDKHQYEPLKHPDIGVYLVNLTAVRALPESYRPARFLVGLLSPFRVMADEGSLLMSSSHAQPS
jgi:hypothetical protein